jgi:hypothetical protein
MQALDNELLLGQALCSYRNPDLLLEVIRRSKEYVAAMSMSL